MQSEDKFSTQIRNPARSMQWVRVCEKIFAELFSTLFQLLGEKPAVLMVRPRGWHLPELHVQVDGESMSGSIFDFALYVFNNAQQLVKNGTGPYFYLPKMQSYHEAELWNEIFDAAEDYLHLPRGTIKVTTTH